MSATDLAKKYKQQVLKQQQLQLQANDVVLDEIADAINKTSSTSEKRPLSLRVSEAKACKKHRVSPDATKVSGLNGTLGSNLVKLSDELPSKTMRERYFSILSRNGIIDISDDKDGSQLHALDGGSNTKKNIVGKVKNASPPKKIEDCDDYLHADDKRLLKNVDGPSSAKKCIEQLTSRSTTEKKQMASIDVVINILKQHTFKSHMLSDKYLEEGSETSLIVKYWGMVFEAYFSYHQDIQLQWGDTSSSIQQVRHLFNLDIRVLATNYTTHIEAATGEVAKVAAVTETKLFQDRLKSVLVSKAHLNSILKKMPNITEDMVKSIQVPIIQALGTTCFVYSMTLIDKKLYTLQEVCDFRYPRTYADLRDGTILLKLLRSLDLVMKMITELTEMQSNYSRTTTDKAKMILKKTTRKSKPIVFSDWVANVEWDGVVEEMSATNEEEESTSSEED